MGGAQCLEFVGERERSGRCLTQLSAVFPAVIEQQLVLGEDLSGRTEEQLPVINIRHQILLLCRPAGGGRPQNNAHQKNPKKPQNDLSEKPPGVLR